MKINKLINIENNIMKKKNQNKSINNWIINKLIVIMGIKNGKNIHKLEQDEMVKKLIELGN